MASGINQLPTATLHYIYDPFCGWCYAAAPLAQAASTIPGLEISLHGGGMLSGNNRRQITSAWRDYVIPHDKRIATLSGQVFGDAYFNGLLTDSTAILDSTPPITAILCAQAMQGIGLDMLHGIQAAHYQHGKKVAERPVLTSLAVEMGLDKAEFEQLFVECMQHQTQQHIHESRELLAESGGNGFPCFMLELPGKGLQILDVSAYLGQAQSWRAAILAHMTLSFSFNQQENMLQR